jgi:hypothetical protein
MTELAPAWVTLGAHGCQSPVGTTQAGRAANAVPRGVQWTRSRDSSIGKRSPVTNAR